MQLQIQQRLEGANPVVVATLNDFSPLPHGNVFIYENNGGTTLGDYVGVASLDEYLSLNVWTGQTVVYGNRYMLYPTARFILFPGQYDFVKTLMTTLLSQLQTSYTSTYPLITTQTL